LGGRANAGLAILLPAALCSLRTPGRHPRSLAYARLRPHLFQSLMEEVLKPSLKRSTLPLADDCRDFLNRNLSALPEDCSNGIFKHLRREQHHRDGFFELVVARTLQELGVDIECEPENPIDRSRIDYSASFPDGMVFVEAVSPVLDRELGAVLKRESPLAQLITDSVPPGWTADIRELPNVGPDESKRHIKAFLRKEMDIPPPTYDDEEVGNRRVFRARRPQGDSVPAEPSWIERGHENSHVRCRVLA
jgi:hypothetical protein